MLLRFAFRNSRSWLDDAELLASAQEGLKVPAGALRLEAGCCRALPVTVLMGANASGKTNLVRALRGTVLAALGEAAPGEGAPCRASAKAGSESGFEIEVAAVSGGKRTQLRYGFSVAEGEVVSESLEKRLQGARWELVFARSADGLELSGLSGKSAETVLTELRGDSLLVTLPLRDGVILLLRRELARFCFVDFEAPEAGPARLPARFTVDPAVRRAFANFLKSFDPTVESVALTHRGRAGDPLSRVLVMHSGADGKPFPVALPDESAGTLKMASFFRTLSTVLANGGTLVVDGLNATLHPLLLKQVVELFASGETNRAGAQILFTAHDATTLRNKLLAPDALWLVEKGGDGTSTLRRLSEGKRAPKKAGAKLENAYVKGKLGGVPAGRLVVPAPIARGDRKVVLVDEKTFRKLAKKGRKAAKS